MENLFRVQKISKENIDSTVKKAVLLIALLVPLLLLNACASGPPTREELNSADYGSPITQQDAEEQARQFLKYYLKDPGSATYDWSPVYQGWLREAPLHGGGLKFGYVPYGKYKRKK